MNSFWETKDGKVGFFVRKQGDYNLLQLKNGGMIWRKDDGISHLIDIRSS